MISHKNIDLLARKLRVYDVDQGAWEQEPNGPEANYRHVLTHLAKDLVKKDFTDVDQVRAEIVPDSVQHALRLSRWAGVFTYDLLQLTEAEEEARDTAEEGLRDLPLGFPSFAGAVSVLAQNLHDLDHEKEREKARVGEFRAVRTSARLLINSATIQSHQFRFSLMEAFDARLGVLRDRFGIPNPR